MSSHDPSARVRASPGRTAGVVALALATAILVRPAAGIEYPPLFGSHEVRSNNLEMFTKWTAALARARGARGRRGAECVRTPFDRCNDAAWRRFLEGLRDRAPLARVVAVNRYMNRKRYVIDPRNYGVLDYWAAPVQFLERHGDCEDYAIAKFLSLKALGFTDDEMRIVVLRDLNLGIAHAVLVVYMNGQALVLDNQIKDVVAAEVIRHYVPIYSINERYWWLHRITTARAPARAVPRPVARRRAGPRHRAATVRTRAGLAKKNNLESPRTN